MAQYATIYGGKGNGMSRKSVLDQWLANKPGIVQWREMEPVVNEAGFESWEVNHGIRISHPKLSGNPRFPDGIIQVNDHYKKQGQVHPYSMKDFLNAVKWLRAQK